MMWWRLMCNIWEGGECKDVGNGDEINGKKRREGEKLDEEHASQD
jgi:hypothetical protein